jgi:hypothetical protein
MGKDIEDTTWLSIIVMHRIWRDDQYQAHLSAAAAGGTHTEAVLGFGESVGTTQRQRHKVNAIKIKKPAAGAAGF